MQTYIHPRDKYTYTKEPYYVIIVTKYRYIQSSTTLYKCTYIKETKTLTPKSPTTS